MSPVQELIEGGAPLPLPAAPFIGKGGYMGKDIYLPVIDTLKALGVPDENLNWDGQTLKVYMCPDYWFEIDAGDNLLKLNGYTMEYCDQIKTEYTGDLVRIYHPRIVNGAAMLNGGDTDYIYNVLTYTLYYKDAMGSYSDVETGIVFFEKINK